MRLSFIFPAALALLLVLIPLWALALSVPRRLPPNRFWTSLIIRSVLIICLILAVAGVQMVQRVDHLTTVFVIDSSDSISPSARAQAEAFVQDALQAMRPEDQAAIVVFGENALVERVPSESQSFNRMHSVPRVARTDIESALQLGMAILPADTQKRLVLLSDGGENIGQALEVAQLSSSRDIPISYVDLSTPATSESMITSLDAPASVRQGQNVDLVVTIESSQDQQGQLRVFGDETMVFEQNVQLQTGPNRFSLQVEASEHGFQRYRAEIIPEIDDRAQNNQADVLVRVDGPPHILLIEGQRGEAEQFKIALESAEITADIVTPDTMPTDLTSLSNYEAVVLLNVPARDLPVQAMADLPVYVRELGRGLIMIGGDQSYGVGGYGRTPIEETLPVYMDVRDREERPDLAMLFIIDKSGSMDSCHCSGPNRQTAQFQRGGVPKVDIAKDAVIQASAVLSEHDNVGVVTFDDNAHWALPIQRGPTADVVQSALAPVAPEGATNILAGLQSAEESLLNTDARIKHAILLTDGWSGDGDNLAIAERMRNEGITLSVIAAGGGSAEYLESLANAGGGRFYPTEDMEEVPQIFVQETITAVGNYLLEEAFTPAYVGTSTIMEGLNDGLPQLYGYNGTTLKDTAGVVLSGVDEAPVLAKWQYGLGRSIAWTSDVKGRWAQDWVNWPAFPQFTAQMVGWVLPTDSETGVSAEFQTVGSQTIMDVNVQDPGGETRDGLTMQATIIGADGTTQQVPLTQVSPGQYRASIASPTQGSYLVQLVGEEDGRAVVQDTAGLVVPYSPEYRQGQSDPDLLEAIARTSGGTALSNPVEAFDHNLSGVSRAQDIAFPLLLFALILLPFDIGVRRLVLRRSDFTDTLNMFSGRKRSPAEKNTNQNHFNHLRQAKQRALHRTQSANTPKPPVVSTQEDTSKPAKRTAKAPASTPPQSAAQPSKDELMDRLLAARQRARRKARGEEEE